MGTELEWKLTVPEPGLLDTILNWDGIRTQLAEKPRLWHMQTTYYDTADRALARRQITLRRRMENERSVLCVKAPLSGAADCRLHGEWELQGDDIAAALPRLVAMGAPEALLGVGKPLPVCGADFHRRAALLRFPDGSACELALDRGTLFGPTRSEPLCELELELKAGDSAATKALFRILQTRFGLIPQAKSKFARAREL